MCVPAPLLRAMPMRSHPASEPISAPAQWGCRHRHLRVTNETRRQPAAWWGASQAAGPLPSPCLLELGIFCFHLSRPTTLGVFPLSWRLIHRFTGRSYLVCGGEWVRAKKRRAHQRRARHSGSAPEGSPALLRLQASPTPPPRARPGPMSRPHLFPGSCGSGPVPHFTFQPHLDRAMLPGTQQLQAASAALWLPVEASAQGKNSAATPPPWAWPPSLHLLPCPSSTPGIGNGKEFLLPPASLGSSCLHCLLL